MAKKKPPEEHENLERYLVSYADFMTLMFATFVVLYALAQSDVNSFKGIEEALRKAFSQNIFDNQANVLEGHDSIFSGEDGATTPLMLEYMSPKYEQSSYEEIKEKIDNLNNKDITAEIDDRGLVIKLDNNVLKFAGGRAELNKEAKTILDTIAKTIKEKFAIHYIRVEGHTDSDRVPKISPYPSNWELSAARACSVVRYLIDVHDFNSKLFVAVGLADTVPVLDNLTPANKAKNRRVEIVVLKNKNKNLSKKNMQKIIKEIRENQKKNINMSGQSAAIRGLVGNDRELLKNVIDLSDSYENENKRLEEIDNGTYIEDGIKPDFLEK